MTSASAPWAPIPGVGIEVVAADGVVKVLRPIEGSPGRAAGILARR